MCARREEEDKVSTDVLRVAQHEVQRLLGRCLLRLQQYEILMKRILALHDVTGPSPQLVARQDKRVEKLATTNLGRLAQILFESFVVIRSSNDSEATAPDPGAGDEVRFRTVTRMQMEPQDYAVTKKAVEELIQMRNSLVHHFIEEFDVWSADGCAKGAQHLVVCHERIDGHFEQLSSWAAAIQEAARVQISFLNSPEFVDFLDGIGPEGQIMWPETGIARCLIEATSLRAPDGWTRLDEAVIFISEKYPEQNLKRYGCTSWPQAVDRSQAFDLRHRGDVGAPKISWYRERPRR